MLEARSLEQGQRLCNAVRRVAFAGREQLAAVCGDRQVRVMGAFPHQSKQREHAGPGTEAIGQRALVSVELFEQPVEPVAAVIERVVARQQFARFGEQDHHQPHRHPAGGAIDVNRRRGSDRRRIVVIRRDFGQRDTGIVRQILAVLGDVEFRPLDQGAQGFAMASNQDLDGFADPLAEHLGQLRLALARVSNGLQQARGRVVGPRRP